MWFQKWNEDGLLVTHIKLSGLTLKYIEKNALLKQIDLQKITGSRY